jgi:hypothetical protein
MQIFEELIKVCANIDDWAVDRVEVGGRAHLPLGGVQPPPPIWWSKQIKLTQKEPKIQQFFLALCAGGR